MSRNKGSKKDTSKGSSSKTSRGRRAIGKDIIAFPGKLLIPVGKFLHSRLKKLEKRRKKIEEDDPFQDTSRVVDNASPDTDAAEQFGHARATAIKEQLDKTIIQTKKALARIKLGKYGLCEDCGQMIDTDRLMVKPEATLCAKCKVEREK
jgi:DnaK suppressor protein